MDRRTQHCSDALSACSIADLIANGSCFQQSSTRMRLAAEYITRHH